jgi:hypothetical protein
MKKTDIFNLIFIIFSFVIIVYLIYIIFILISKIKYKKLCNKPSEYDAQIWNDNNVEYNNCYSYAMRDINNLYKPSPGNNMKNSNYDMNSCEEIISHIKHDYPDRNVKVLDDNNTRSCEECNYYKVGLYIDDNNKDDVDFHFYRQNRDGYWSHKPGSNLVTNKDADGKLITDPDKANRDYGELNYSKKCNKLCVPFKYNEKIDPIIL